MKIRSLALSVTFALLTTNITISAKDPSPLQPDPNTPKTITVTVPAPTQHNRQNWLKWNADCKELSELLKKESLGPLAEKLEAFQAKCLNALKEIDPQTKKQLYPSQVFAKNSQELAKLTIEIITEFGKPYGVTASSLQHSVDNAKKDISQKIRDITLSKSDDAQTKEHQAKLMDAQRIFDLTSGLNRLFASTYNVAQLSTE
jgi:hypothetical protein